MPQEMSTIEAMKIRMRARLQMRQILDNKWVSQGLGAGYLLASSLSSSPKRKLELLTTASRRCESKPLQSWCRRQLKPWLKADKAQVWREQQVGWQRYYNSFGHIDRDTELTSSLLLKEPGPNGEKGVLHCPFEYNWMRLLSNCDARKLFRDYYLVGASSWSPTDHAVLANLCGLSEDPLFIGISNRSDIAQYQMYSPDIQPLPIMACDWRSPHDFAPKDHADRSIDILMVSHFAEWKRHWLLFEALRTMRKDLRIVLIGRNSPTRDENTLRREAKAFSAPQELTIHRNLENDEVARYQCDAKVCVALSKREGACVAITEALFADSPVAIMNDAHIGAREHINGQTGQVMKRGNIARTLSEMIETSARYSPRAWASENISAQISSEKLNAILRQHSLQSGRPWTRDIAPFCRRYVPRYLNLEDKLRLRQGLKKLQDQHGIVLKEFISEKQAHNSKAS